MLARQTDSRQLDAMNKGQTTSGWKITIPQAASFILAGIYLSGFLGLNVHLGKHGVFDFDLASSRYLIVGVLFFSFLVFWYLFGGRAIIFGTKRLRNELALVERSDLGPVWKGLSYVNFLIELTFQHLLSAALFSHLILGDKEPTWFLRYLIVLFLILYPWDSLNLDRRFPRAHQILNLTTKTSAILLFLITITLLSPTSIVLINFIVITFYANLVLDSMERFKITVDTLVYDITYTLIFVLLFSAAFGAAHYEHITSAFGGGQLQPVEIIVADQTTREGLDAMGFRVTPLLKAELIHENHQELIVGVEGQTIRLPRKAISGIKVAPVEDIHWILKFLTQDAPLGRELEGSAKPTPPTDLD